MIASWSLFRLVVTTCDLSYENVSEFSVLEVRRLYLSFFLNSNQGYCCQLIGFFSSLNYRLYFLSINRCTFCHSGFHICIIFIFDFLTFLVSLKLRVLAIKAKLLIIFFNLIWAACFSPFVCYYCSDSFCIFVAFGLIF